MKKSKVKYDSLPAFELRYKRIKKTKDQRIQEAVDLLNKAIKIEEPHIQIDIQGGFERTSESEEFTTAIKNFIQAYRKFYKMDKIEVNLLL